LRHLSSLFVAVTFVAVTLQWLVLRYLSSLQCHKQWQILQFLAMPEASSQAAGWTNGRSTDRLAAETLLPAATRQLRFRFRLNKAFVLTRGSNAASLTRR